MRLIGPMIALIALSSCELLSNEPYVMPESVVRPFADFVAQQTGYPLDPLPRVVVSRQATRSALVQYGYDADGFALGYYAKPEKTIYLDNTNFAYGDARWRGLLVHELTHHGQLLAAKQFRCAGEAEAEAYTVQNAYLLTEGEQLISPEAIQRLARCQ